MGAVGKKDMQAKARDVYREHYAMVRRVTPKEKLLEYRLGEGWEPLCRFLGKEVPDVPFPKVNDAEVHSEQLKVIMMRGIWNMLGRIVRVLGPLAVVAAAWWVARRYYSY